jgi:hypothetical protein
LKQERTTTIKVFRAIFGLLLSISLLLIGQACELAGVDFSTPTPTPVLAAQEIADRSSRAMLELGSMHFEIGLTGALAYVDNPPTTALKAVSGDLLRPDKVKAVVRLSSLGLVTEVGLISIEGASYVTNPLNQRWEALPPEWGWYFDPRLPFDETVGIPAVVPQVRLEKVGLEERDGTTFYHLRGVARGEQITAWTAGLIAEGEVPVDLWIDTDTFLIHRVHLVELSSKPENPTEWDISLSAFDQPVEVQAPPLDGN